MARRSGALPTFLIIGRPKCATTSLHHYLGLHPEIQTSARKELRFFIAEPDLEKAGSPPPSKRGNWDRGIDWYASHFDPGAPIRGEASPEYTSPWFPDCAERVFRTLGAIPLIYCVRDPVERTLAHWHDAVELGRESRPIEQALTVDSSYVRGSRYADALAPFLRHWSTDSICVIDQHELATERRATLARVFAFVGAEPDFYDERFAVELNRGRAKSGARYRALALLRRRRWWPQIADRLPAAGRGTVERLIGGRQPARALAPRAIPPAHRRELERALRAETDRFRDLTGRSFETWSV